MKQRMRNKKYLDLAFAALGLAILAPGASQAFSSLSKVTNTAVAGVVGTGSVQMSVSVISLNTLTADTAVNWNNVTLPTSFRVADDYIQLNSTITAAGGGIQIYTDNTAAADANPLFTGVISSTTLLPAGLVDTANTVFTLPIAWSIKSSTNPANSPSVKPVAADPNNNGQNGKPTDNNAFQWLFMEDHAQVAVPNLNASAFRNSDPFVTVQAAEQGIHFGQANNEFGPGPTPYYLYLEANFGFAITPRTYKTSTLRLEAFTQ